MLSFILDSCLSCTSTSKSAHPVSSSVKASPSPLLLHGPGQVHNHHLLLSLNGSLGFCPHSFHLPGKLCDPSKMYIRTRVQDPPFLSVSIKVLSMAHAQDPSFLFTWPILLIFHVFFTRRLSCFPKQVKSVWSCSFKVPFHNPHPTCNTRLLSARIPHSGHRASGCYGERLGMCSWPTRRQVMGSMGSHASQQSEDKLELSQEKPGRCPAS